MTRKPYRRHDSPPTHGFLPSVTLFWPHYCRQGAQKRHAVTLGRRWARPPSGPACAGLASTIKINPIKSNTYRYSSVERRRRTGAWPRSPPRLQLTPQRASIGLPAQEGRDVELVLLAAVMHRRLPSMLVQPLRRRALGILGHRFRTRLRRPRLLRTLPRRRPSRKPLGADAAWAAWAAASRASKALPRRPARGGRGRQRPAVAAATSAVFPDAPPAARRGGREARSAPGPAVRRCAACACCATASVPAAAE